MFEDRLKEAQSNLAYQSHLEGLESICCEECSKELTHEEVLDARDMGLHFDEISCTQCWDKWHRQKMEEIRHPDEVHKFI